VLAGDVKLEELEELEELSPTPARNGSGLHIAALLPAAHVVKDDDEWSGSASASNKEAPPRKPKCAIAVEGSRGGGTDETAAQCKRQTMRQKRRNGKRRTTEFSSHTQRQ
jgi:hypothetical protein